VTAEQWAKVQSVFESALDLDPEQRIAFVRATEPDPNIRAEVESLLSNSADDEFLRAPALADASAALVNPDALDVDANIHSAAALIGTIAGDRYRLDRVLARGAHGLVFLASDLRLAGRNVVVKVLDEAAEHQDWLQRRFRQEIAILGRISHAGVAGIRDCGEIGDQPFLVMDFVDGVTLREFMKSGSLPIGTVAEIVAQIGSALHAAHMQGIVHRDLKPENMMVQPGSADGEHAVAVTLIDFGIAQAVRTESGRTTTVIMVAGTAPYMAPEQFLGMAQIASDIYALAVVCFEMLAGTTPYTGKDPLQLATAQRAKPPKEILRRSSSIPKAVKPLLESALAVDPEQRPGDAQNFGTALRGALLQPASGWISRRRVVAGAFALVLIGAILSMRFVWNRGSSDVQTSITMSGLNDPLEQGFVVHEDVKSAVELTPDGTGIQAWEVRTHSQGFYGHRLNRSQISLAMTRGWKLTGSAKLLEGALYMGPDFYGGGPRFATGATLDGDALNARAWTDQASGEWQSLTARIPGDPRGYHDYQLVYDAKRRTLSIAVDGIVLIRGYSGLTQFQGYFGVAFGVHRWKSTGAQARFRYVRFEIQR